MHLTDLLNVLARETQPLSYLVLSGAEENNQNEAVFIIMTDIFGQSFAAVYVSDVDADFVSAAHFALSAEDNDARSLADEACRALGLKRNIFALECSADEPKTYVWQSTE